MVSTLFSAWASVDANAIRVQSFFGFIFSASSFARAG